MKDAITTEERADVGVALAPPEHDEVKWHAKWQVQKFDNTDLEAAGIDVEEPDWASIEKALAEGKFAPTETIDREGNLLVYGGASALWDLLIGAGTVAAFTNAVAHIGVGNSATAAAATQTDLVGASKDRQPMEATYPQHTDGTGASTNADIVFRSVWGTAEGNFAWEEWGVFNAAAAGRMLNRKVESLGTKTSAATWTLTVTLTLA